MNAKLKNQLELLENELLSIQENIERLKEFEQESLNSKYTQYHSHVVGEFKHRLASFKHRITQINRYLSTSNLTEE